MGQQQLLLLVMGVIVVGLAVMVGIQLFSENQQKANADALVLRSLRIANDAQRWLRTPSAMGGGRTETLQGDFTGLTLDLGILGYKVDVAKKYSDLDGTYLGSVSGSEFLIEARSHPISGRPGNLICVNVAGVQMEDITTQVNPTGDTCS